jgi:hypothetical protein
MIGILREGRSGFPGTQPMGTDDIGFRGLDDMEFLLGGHYTVL